MFSELEIEFGYCDLIENIFSNTSVVSLNNLLFKYYKTDQKLHFICVKSRWRRYRIEKKIQNNKYIEIRNIVITQCAKKFFFNITHLKIMILNLENEKNNNDLNTIIFFLKFLCKRKTRKNNCQSKGNVYFIFEWGRLRNIFKSLFLRFTKILNFDICIRVKYFFNQVL